MLYLAIGGGGILMSVCSGIGLESSSRGYVLLSHDAVSERRPSPRASVQVCPGLIWTSWWGICCSMMSVPWPGQLPRRQLWIICHSTVPHMQQRPLQHHQAQRLHLVRLRWARPARAQGRVHHHPRHLKLRRPGACGPRARALIWTRAGSADLFWLARPCVQRNVSVV